MRCSVVFAFLAPASSLDAGSAAAVSPVEKVIELMTDLLDEVKHEDETEATTYDEFACFCKSNTESKAEAIQDEQDFIEGEVARLQEETTISNAKAQEIKELDQSIAKLNKDMTGIASRREKVKTKYEAEAADLAKGTRVLEGAIADMKADRPSSLAQIKSAMRKSFLMADTLDLDPARSRGIHIMGGGSLLLTWTKRTTTRIPNRSLGHLRRSAPSHSCSCGHPGQGHHDGIGAHRGTKHGGQSPLIKTLHRSRGHPTPF